MSLRERLSGEHEAFESQRQETAKLEQEAALVPTRARIAQLEADKKELELLRSQIGTDLESFLVSVKTFKGKSAQIDKLRTEFADVLAQKGIVGKGQLVEGADYQEEPEVKE